VPQSLPDSSSQKRERSLYCGSRQPSVRATSMMRVAGSVVSTGVGTALAASAVAAGDCQACWPAHWSKQARRAWLSLDRAAQRRQAAWSPVLVLPGAMEGAGAPCARAAPAGASTARARAAVRWAAAMPVARARAGRRDGRGVL